MNARAKKLLEEVLELPREERAELVRDVIATLADEDASAAEEWATLVRRRADDVMNGRNIGPDAAQMVREIRARLRDG